MVFWKKKKGDRPASEYEKRALKFDAVRAAFLALHGARYKVTDVKVATFWDPDEDDMPISSVGVSVYFVTKTDEEKEDFRKRFFDEASGEYLKLVSRDSKLQGLTYDFYILSVQEVKRDFDNNWYYAML